MHLLLPLPLLEVEGFFFGVELEQKILVLGLSLFLHLLFFLGVFPQVFPPYFLLELFLFELLDGLVSVEHLG